ncbi:MAG: hypothetical protein BWX55_01868 [Deltaproteobacteria bacterium ADurb.Bin022]|nr:MAG: hypothetical protein BWX55_01868 [Deltaproteobacteria bacterium ADurb.Bin022]
MDIHDPPGKSLKKSRRDDTHKTGQRYQLDVMFYQRVDKFRIKFLFIFKIAVFQHTKREAVFFCPDDAVSIRVIADDNLDDRPKRPLLDVINNGLQVGPVS